MNHQGLNDFTPLDLAIHTQSPEVERVLLEHGEKCSADLIVQQQILLSMVRMCTGSVSIIVKHSS